MIKLEKVFFDYEDENDEGSQGVLRGVDLEIEKGQFVAVLGHNGSGKSTLAKLMNGILVPTSGKVTVSGLDTSVEENVWEIRSRVGMVFQNPDNQIVATTVEEDVAFGPENLGIEPAEIRRRVDEALTAVGMTEFRQHSPAQLSGGQKQRVAIAGVLAMHPECILFDESTAMLDPRGREEVMREMLRMKNEGMTVVLITHYMNEAVFADRVVIVNDGKVVMDDTPGRVFSRVDELRAYGLDVPQTTALVHSLVLDGAPLSRELVHEDETVRALSALLKL